MAQTSHPLAGKVALVTGGSRGIGAAIVRRLARDGADGAFSYAASQDKAERLVRDIEALGRRAVAIKADQGVASEVRSLVQRAHAAFGRLDILVNSAGVFVTGMVGDPEADLAAFEPPDRRQREGNGGRGPRLGAADGGRRAHRVDRDHGRGAHPVRRSGRLRGHQGGRRRLHARLGA